ncbi:MAG TPA: mannosyltransferase family protein [Patescibacteria group bacterium]|nr:mannosyltransferase family protein [Patescibacteria group bacterium]
MKRSEILFIISSFLVWRVFILVVAIFSIKYLPLFSQNYFGGGYSNYISNPIFWGHGNFDGEHYLSIAQNGYQPLEYFFFPLFPLLIRFLTISKSLINFAWTGIIISNLFFLISLFFLYKLVKIDYSDKIAKPVMLLLLLFPTSFYFGNIYTESLFFLLAILSFYFARKKNYLVAAFFVALASATRVIGIFLLPVIFVEWFFERRHNYLEFLEILIISPIGLLYYMYFLLKETHDPLIFVHQVSIFGQQRSSSLVILPQVIYRYIFEIFPHVSYLYFPNVFTTYLEFSFAILFLALIIFGVFKLRLSYSLYAAVAFIIPTLAGSFSSMPRYILVIFPVFILVGVYLAKLPKIYTYVLFFVMIVLFVIAESFFWRGYWVS